MSRLFQTDRAPVELNREPRMTGTRHLTYVYLVALPIGGALAAGPGGGGTSGGSAGGTGAAGIGSAAVGGGVGRVGGGPPAGLVGGGSPGSNNPAGNGAAGTGDPSLNARGMQITPSRPPSGIENARTTSGYIGEAAGASAKPELGGAAPPPALGQDQPPEARKEVQGISSQPAPPLAGLAVPGPEGSTRTVKARPCGVAAHETDGFTTCIGIPQRR
jgi:hypothetical protein